MSSAPLIAKQVLGLLRGFPSLGLSLGGPPALPRVSPAPLRIAAQRGCPLSGTIPITYHGERYSIPVSATVSQ